MLYAALTDSKILAGDLIFPLIVGLVSGTVVAFISVYFVNRNLKKLSTYQKLSSYGFVEIGTVWQTESEVKKMCKNAETIKLINVSGLKYHRNYEKHIKKALKNGVEIYNLVTDPDSFFLTDIEEMEKKTIWNGQPVRKKETFIKTETKELIDMYKQTNLHIRFYRSEYRLPFIMAYYKDGSIHTWLRVTLPPLRSEQAMVLRGVKESNSMNETILDFIDMMELSFDSIWEHSAWSDKKVEEMRNQALEKAEPEEEAAAPLTDTP